MSVLAEDQLSAQVVSLTNVEVALGGRPVLRKVNWTWRWGESVLVIGPSGSGKSTLAMLAAGLLPGIVEAELSGLVERDARLSRPGAVGYVFQDPDSQFCQLRIGEEIAFGLENQSIPGETMERVVGEVLERTLAADPNLEHARLSGGNKQKLALACALAMNPEILILDEPTANLDPASTAAVFQQIGELLDQGRTLLVIEHKFQLLADRIPWVLLVDTDGTVRRFGPTQMVLQEEQDWLIASGLVDLSDWPQSKAVGAVGCDKVSRLEGVSVRYPRQQQTALSDVSLMVRGGEMVALVGPNGAGKSTLLKVLGGLMRPQSGTVTRTSDQIGFGFQNPEHQFIFERVGDELANRRIEGPIPQDVRDRLQYFNLEGRAGQSPYALSQGQKRRLSVAVMTSGSPDLLCLDEPTFGQDARTRRALMDVLQAHQARGAAVVISTHDLELVSRYATRVVALAGGRIIFDGTPEALRKRTDVMRAARLMADGENGSLKSTDVMPSPNAVRGTRSLVGRVNPAWKLLAVFLAVGLTAFAHQLGQAIPLAAIPIILLVFFSGLTLRQSLGRLAPFVLFFTLYVWTLTAYARPVPHTPTVHILWYTLSWSGFLDGIVLGFRMLAAVAFGLVFVSTVDIVELIKSATRQFRIPPRFSYGTLAGLHFFPVFQEEWSRLRLARRVRGRDAERSLTRVVTYALPILADAVRLSERVAIAMEARGFVGPAATSPRHRSYYRPAPSRWQDGLFNLILLAAAALALWH